MMARRTIASLLIVLATLIASCAAAAVPLTRDEIQKVFPPPLVIGQQDDKLPIWPILKQGSGTWDTIAYVFQSDDFAPIPGFGGSPPNLLIAMSPEGTFIGLKVLAQHEPVFVDGYGQGSRDDFVQQYVGMSARNTIRVGRHNARSAGAAPTSVVDGVPMATASTRVINQEILSSALAVARKRLGRGTFCGWLCPFGAVALIVERLRLPQLAVPAQLDQRLRLVKYVVLAAILVSAFVSAATADKLAEVEPFKTSITLYFVRSWPFVAYAAGLIVLNLFIYKGFCRYLCPLGAALAVGGRLRVFDWIPRRAECGTPCQLCKVKCRYGAIEPSGRVDYPECFRRPFDRAVHTR